MARLLTKLMDGCREFSLERFGLEYDRDGDRVLLKRLKHDLVSPDELAALRLIVNGCSGE